jgi:hypothetical protein
MTLHKILLLSFWHHHAFRSSIPLNLSSFGLCLILSLDQKSASNWFSLVSPFSNSLGAGFWLVLLRGCSWEFRVGVYAGGLCVWVVFLASHYAFFLWVGLISSGISAMERNFSVESKSFSLSVLEGASMVRVEEKRKSFVGAIVLSTQCSDWLASTLETLLSFSGDHDFVKSFREGSKILIAR